MVSFTKIVTFHSIASICIFTEFGGMAFIWYLCPCPFVCVWPFLALHVHNINSIKHGFIIFDFGFCENSVSQVAIKIKPYDKSIAMINAKRVFGVCVCVNVIYVYNTLPHSAQCADCSQAWKWKSIDTKLKKKIPHTRTHNRNRYTSLVNGLTVTGLN